MTPCTHIGAKDSKELQCSQSRQGSKQEIFTRPSQIFSTKRDYTSKVTQTHESYFA